MAPKNSPVARNRGWVQFQKQQERAYDELEEAVVQKQAQVALLLQEIARRIFEARFSEGSFENDGKFNILFVPTRLDEPGRSFNFEQSADLEAIRNRSFARDYAGIKVENCGIEIAIGRVKTAESAFGKNLMAITYDGQERSYHGEAPFVRHDYANAVLVQALGSLKDMGMDSPQAVKWIVELAGVAQEVKLAEDEIYRRVEGAVRADLNCNAHRDDILQMLEGAAKEINHKHRMQYQTVKMKKPDFMAQETGQLWPFHTPQQAGAFWDSAGSAGAKDALDRIANDGLLLLVHFQYEKACDYPRASMLQPVYSYLGGRMASIRRQLGGAPELDAFFSLPKLLLEYDRLCSRLPAVFSELEYDGREGKRRDKFVFYSQVMAAQAELIRACKKATYELRRLPLDEARSLGIGIGRFLVEIAKTNLSDGRKGKLPCEDKVVERLAAALGQWESPHAKASLDRRKAAIAALNREYEALGQKRAQIKGVKLERAKDEQRYRALLAALYFISPIEARAIETHWKERKMHGAHKLGMGLGENMGAVLLPEKLAEASLWLDRLAKNRRAWDRFWNGKRLELQAIAARHFQKDGAEEVKIAREVLGVEGGAGRNFSSHFGNCGVRDSEKTPAAMAARSYLELDSMIFLNLAQKNDSYFQKLASAPESMRAHLWNPEGTGIVCRLENWRDRLEDNSCLVDKGFRHEDILAYYSQSNERGMHKIRVGIGGIGELEVPISTQAILKMARTESALKKRGLDEKVYGDEVTENDYGTIARPKAGQTDYIARMHRMLEGVLHNKKMENTFGKGYQLASVLRKSDYSGTILFGPGREILSIYPQISGADDSAALKQVEGMLGIARARQLKENISRYLIETALSQYMQQKHRAKYDIADIFGKLLLPKSRAHLNEMRKEGAGFRRMVLR